MFSKRIQLLRNQLIIYYHNVYGVFEVCAYFIDTPVVSRHHKFVNLEDWI